MRQRKPATLAVWKWVAASRWACRGRDVTRFLRARAAHWSTLCNRLMHRDESSRCLVDTEVSTGSNVFQIRELASCDILSDWFVSAFSLLPSYVSSLVFWTAISSDWFKLSCTRFNASLCFTKSYTKCSFVWFLLFWFDTHHRMFCNVLTDAYVGMIILSRYYVYRTALSIMLPRVVDNTNTFRCLGGIWHAKKR